VNPSPSNSTKRCRRLRCNFAHVTWDDYAETLGRDHRLILQECIAQQNASKLENALIRASTRCWIAVGSSVALASRIDRMSSAAAKKPSPSNQKQVSAFVQLYNAVARYRCEISAVSQLHASPM